MKTKFTMLLTAGLLFAAVATQAQTPIHDRREIRQDRREIRYDRRDIRHDRRDFARDHRDLYRDRRDLRFDRRNGYRSPRFNRPCF